MGKVELRTSLRRSQLDGSLFDRSRSASGPRVTESGVLICERAPRPCVAVVIGEREFAIDGRVRQDERACVGVRARDPARWMCVGDDLVDWRVVVVANEPTNA